MSDHSKPEAAEGMPLPCADHTHEHVGWRKWGPLIGYLILMFGITFALMLAYNANRQYAKQNRIFITRIANDCFDRDGDLSYRHVLRGLIRMNHNRDPFTNGPLDPKTTPDQRRMLTAQLLQRGLEEAGPIPACIEHVP